MALNAMESNHLTSLGLKGLTLFYYRLHLAARERRMLVYCRYDLEDPDAVSGQMGDV